MSNNKRKPHPVQLGSIAQSYIDDLAKHGKAEMRRRLRAASNAMIEYTLANHKHTQYCACRPK